MLLKLLILWAMVIGQMNGISMCNNDEIEPYNHCPYKDCTSF